MFIQVMCVWIYCFAHISTLMTNVLWGRSEYTVFDLFHILHICIICLYMYYNNIQTRSTDYADKQKHTHRCLLLYSLLPIGQQGIMSLCQPKMYVKGSRRRGRPHLLYIFWISIDRRVNVYLSSKVSYLCRYLFPPIATILFI